MLPLSPPPTYLLLVRVNRKLRSCARRVFGPAQSDEQAAAHGRRARRPRRKVPTGKVAVSFRGRDGRTVDRRLHRGSSLVFRMVAGVRLAENVWPDSGTGRSVFRVLIPIPYRPDRSAPNRRRPTTPSVSIPVGAVSVAHAGLFFLSFMFVVFVAVSRTYYDFLPRSLDVCFIHFFDFNKTRYS